MSVQNSSEKVTFILFNKLHSGLFIMVLLSSADFFQNELFQTILSGILSACQIVRIRSGLMFCQSCSGSKLFAKVTSRRQKERVNNDKSTLLS